MACVLPFFRRACSHGQHRAACFPSFLPFAADLQTGQRDHCHSRTSGSRKQVLHKFSGRFPVTKMFSVDRVPAGWAVVQARHFADGALSAIGSS